MLLFFTKLQKLRMFRRLTHHAEVQYFWSEILKEVPFDWIVSVGRLVTAGMNYNIVRGYATLQIILLLQGSLAVLHAALVLGILCACEPVRRVAQNVALGVSGSADIRNVRNTIRILHLRKLYEISRRSYKRKELKPYRNRMFCSYHIKNSNIFGKIILVKKKNTYKHTTPVRSN